MNKNGAETAGGHWAAGGFVVGYVLSSQSNFPDIYGWPPEYSFTSWMKYFSGLVRYSPFR